MKLLKNAIFAIMLVLPVFVFSSNIQAGVTWPVSVQWYDWDSGPGTDYDWRIIFHIPALYSISPYDVRIFGRLYPSGGWKDVTQNPLYTPNPWCRADLVSYQYISGFGKYEVIYKMGGGRASALGCLLRRVLTTSDFYLTYS